MIKGVVRVETAGIVTPVQNAIDSLRRIAEELERGRNALALKGALAWGWHAAGLLAYLRLQPGREALPARGG